MRITIAILLTALLLPLSARAQQHASASPESAGAARTIEPDRGGIKWLVVSMLVSQAADIATTSIALRRGCTESTYYGMQNRWAIGAMKGGGAIALSVTLPFAHNKRPKLTKALLWAQIASGAIGATVNTTRLPHC